MADLPNENAPTTLFMTEIFHITGKLPYYVHNSGFRICQMGGTPPHRVNALQSKKYVEQVITGCGIAKILY